MINYRTLSLIQDQSHICSSNSLEITWNSILLCYVKSSKSSHLASRLIRSSLQHSFAQIRQSISFVFLLVHLSVFPSVRLSIPMSILQHLEFRWNSPKLTKYDKFQILYHRSCCNCCCCCYCCCFCHFRKVAVFLWINIDHNESNNQKKKAPPNKTTIETYFMHPSGLC